VPRKEDRLFTKQPFKLYRRTYSRAEARWGVVILVGLAALTAWVVWKGANPDPSLFPDEIPGLKNRAPAASVDRGVVPEGLAPDGWRERNLASFDPTNLYVKINGREGYYKQFGFERLVFLTLEDESDATRAIDIEAYELTHAANALGAFAGETPEGATPEVLEDGLVRLDQNALYVARGEHYVRCIAGDASEATQAALAGIRAKLLAGIEGEALPWSYGLFLKLGATPAKIAVVPEDAFSFGFARDVHKAELGEDLVAFVVAKSSAGEAEKMAAQFVEGFMTYGEKSGDFVKDRYLNLLAGTRVEGRFVLGVRGAADEQAAAGTLDKLAAAVSELPASAAQPAAPAEEEDVEGEAESGDDNDEDYEEE
jgi:hypothetical protein